MSGIRSTIRDAARRSQMSSARATVRTAKDGHLMQELDIDTYSSHGHTGVERFENYGVTSFPHDQDEDQQGQQQQGKGGQGGEGGGPGQMGQGKMGKQSKSPSAEACVIYHNYSHPIVVAVSDRRHRVRDQLEEEQQQGQQGGGQGGGAGGAGGAQGGQGQGQGEDQDKTKAGDVYLHRGKDDVTQVMLREEGMYHVTRDDRKIRMALVPKPQQQQMSQQQQANGTGGGQSGGGQQKSQKSKKDHGQRPKRKDAEDSKTFIEVEGKTVRVHRGDGHHEVSDKKVTSRYKDDEISMMVTDKHVHIRFKEFRIFVDETGCHSTHPITIKSDPHDQ